MMAKLRQICLTPSQNFKQLVHPKEVDHETRVQQRHIFEQSLLESCPRSQFPAGLLSVNCPYPILMTKDHVSELKEFHQVLSRVIINIVERWWTDERAQFPKRMPLEPYEEQVLQWLATRSDGAAQTYQHRQGAWRPDFLLEDSGEGDEEENFRLCEINARFVWNGNMIAAYGQKALQEAGSKSCGAVPEPESDVILDGLATLFVPGRPLHLLKGREHGIGIHLVGSWLERRIGSRPRIIGPDKLRLIPDTASPTGFSLHCVVEGGCNGTGQEVTEPIFQVGLELHQEELRDLPTPILQHLGLCCFNDFHTIFLVHDKRMLGVVLQELDSFVESKIITRREANLVRRHIAMTIIPGSDEAESLIEACSNDLSLKDDFVLKLIRSGKGKGMIFGSDLSQTEWMDRILALRDAKMVPDKPVYVAQKLVRQQTYELILREDQGLQRNALVGTYASFQGRFVGPGVWRSSPERICAVSSGGAWLCSVKAIDVQNGKVDDGVAVQS